MSPTSVHAAAVPAASAVGSPPIRAMLRLEALAVVAASLAGYSYLGLSWWLFAALIFVPDLSGLGYLAGTKAGAWCYNLAHTYAVPVILGLVGYLTHEPLVMAIAAVWMTHIGIDRVVGYGLKFAGDPKDTHMSRLSVSPTRVTRA